MHKMTKIIYRKIDNLLVELYPIFIAIQLNDVSIYKNMV